MSKNKNQFEPGELIQLQSCIAMAKEHPNSKIGKWFNKLSDKIDILTAQALSTIPK